LEIISIASVERGTGEEIPMSVPSSRGSTDRMDAVTSVDETDAFLGVTTDGAG
jgi:hypothetical protein